MLTSSSFTVSESSSDEPCLDTYLSTHIVSYFQPDPQSYPVNGGSTFPAAHGQTASFFQASGVQQEFAFIPDDGSATYVINVETNTTQSLAGPSTKDAKATSHLMVAPGIALEGPCPAFGPETAAITCQEPALFSEQLQAVVLFVFAVTLGANFTIHDLHLVR